MSRLSKMSHFAKCKYLGVEFKWIHILFQLVIVMMMMCHLFTPVFMINNDDEGLSMKQSKIFNIYCNKDEECGEHATCFNNICLYKVNHLQRSNKIDFPLKFCKHDFECPNYATCNTDGICICDSMYKVSEGECVYRCRSNFDCGLNSYCHNETCLCQPGYVANLNGINCDLKTCFIDSECEERWNDTQCNKLGNYCECDEGFYSGINSNLCIKVDDDSSSYSSYSFFVENIYTIVIVTNFFLWFSILIFILQYVKKRRAATAASTQHRTNLYTRQCMMMNLPPDCPPPPPTYDNIGFHHHQIIADHSYTRTPPPYTATVVVSYDNNNNNNNNNHNDSNKTTTANNITNTNTTNFTTMNTAIETLSATISSQSTSYYIPNK